MDDGVVNARRVEGGHEGVTIYHDGRGRIYVLKTLLTEQWHTARQRAAHLFAGSLGQAQVERIEALLAAEVEQHANV